MSNVPCNALNRPVYVYVCVSCAGARQQKELLAQTVVACGSQHIGWTIDGKRGMRVRAVREEHDNIYLYVKSDHTATAGGPPRCGCSLVASFGYRLVHSLLFDRS